MILYITFGLIVLGLCIVILLQYWRIRKLKKKFIDDYDRKLILFIIDMYVSYGGDLEIFPNDEAKEILLNKIETLKNKLENEQT